MYMDMKMPEAFGSAILAIKHYNERKYIEEQNLYLKI